MATRSKHQAPPQERSNGKGNEKKAIVVTDADMKAAQTVERAAKRVGAEVIIALHQMPQENLSS